MRVFGAAWSSCVILNSVFGAQRGYGVELSRPRILGEDAE